MGREIKFRAFSQYKGMVDICSTTNQVTIVMWPTMRACEYDKDGCQVDIPLMQYTGLTDKNGVEIYEGDLLLTKETRICEVIFHNEAGCWDLVPRNILSSVSIGPVSPASYQYHTEVIGNIHTTPELMESK